VLNTGRNSDSMALYMQRYDGRSAAFRDSITHLWMALGRNDCGVGTLGAMKSNYAKIIDPFLARGIQVQGNTITPYSNSSDGWVSTAGQSVITSGNREGIRLEFNAWLRANWRALGLMGLADWARVMDPTDSGKWGFDPVGTGRSAQGFATLDANGAVSTCIMGSYLLTNNSGGQDYTANETIPCGVLTYPGATGGGAVITGTANGSGLITRYSILTPGSGYSYPPMVSPFGSWTNDGIHPDSRGYDLIIAGCQMGPEMFVF